MVQGAMNLEQMKKQMDVMWEAMNDPKEPKDMKEVYKNQYTYRRKNVLKKEKKQIPSNMNFTPTN